MKQARNFSLPALPAGADTLTRHFLTQFMHEFSRQRGTDSYYRIYAAIESTAKKTGNRPAVVARALVESGLRAARESFPSDFVEAVESSVAGPQWNLNALTPQQKELLSFWGPAAATGYKRARRVH